MRFRLILLLSLLYLSADGQIISPFNQKEITFKDSSGSYSFLVSGHFHGSSTNSTGFPAKTLTSNLTRINSEEVNFMISLGDLFLDIRNDIPNYREALINKLEMPLFNAPGNHDISGNVYEENFGKTFHSFRIGNDVFLILDTELNDGNLEGDQWDMIQKEIQQGGDHFFFFAHRLIWAEEHPEMKDLFTDNTRSGSGNNFRKELLPQLEKLSQKSPVYFFGGSMGNSPSCFFYHKESSSNITYIATAIRDLPKDAVLRVDIDGESVQFKTIGIPLPIENYDLQFFQPQKKETPGFNPRLVPLYTKQMISHRYFWYGILFSGIMFYLIVWWFRRKRKK